MLKKDKPYRRSVQPIIKFKTAITGCEVNKGPSTATATFNKIGKVISRAAMVSIKVPTMINNRLISKQNHYLLSEKPKFSLDMF